MPTMKMEEILQHLEQIKATQGKEVYEATRRDLALRIILKPNGEEFVGKAFPDLDIEQLKQLAKKEAERPAPTSPEEMMSAMLRQSMPNLRSQAQYNLFMACFEALRVTLNAYFGAELESAAKARQVLDKALDTAAQITQVSERLKDIPPEQRSDQANEFMEPPRQFHELDDQRRLLAELAALPTLEKLGVWYNENRPVMDNIVSQQLRNELFDAIRKRRKELEQLS